MGKIALIDGTVILPVEIADHKAIVIDKDIILDICDFDNLCEDIDIVDVQ